MHRHLTRGLLERAFGPLGTIGPVRCADDDARADDPARPIHPDADETDSDETEHLQDLPDGAGCTEIWEHLSDREDHD